MITFKYIDESGKEYPAPNTLLNCLLGQRLKEKRLKTCLQILVRMGGTDDQGTILSEIGLSYLLEDYAEGARKRGG